MKGTQLFSILKGGPWPKKKKFRNHCSKSWGEISYLDIWLSCDILFPFNYWLLILSVYTYAVQCYLWRLVFSIFGSSPQHFRARYPFLQLGQLEDAIWKSQTHVTFQIRKLPVLLWFSCIFFNFITKRSPYRSLTLVNFISKRSP